MKEQAAGCASAPHSAHPAPAAPSPAGGAQVCPADDAVLLGRVEPLESRQRPLLDAKAALSHVPKNKPGRLKYSSARDCRRERSTQERLAPHPHLPQGRRKSLHSPSSAWSLCQPALTAPSPRSPAVSGTGHPLRRTPGRGPCTPSGICGAAATCNPVQPQGTQPQPTQGPQTDPRAPLSALCMKAKHKHSQGSTGHCPVQPQGTEAQHPLLSTTVLGYSLPQHTPAPCPGCPWLQGLSSITSNARPDVEAYPVIVE